MKQKEKPQNSMKMSNVCTRGIVEARAVNGDGGGGGLLCVVVWVSNEMRV